MRTFLFLLAFLALIWFLVPNDANKGGDGDHQATLADPVAEFHRAGRAMINAGNRLENSPCDPRLRTALHDAAAVYLSSRPQLDTPMTNEETDVISEATSAGIVTAADWLGPLAFLAQKQQSNMPAAFDSLTGAGKFKCQNG
jgi:hypothetical protein